MLADQLQITTSAALARADPQAITDAMSGRVRPTPSLEKVLEWQEHARRKNEGAAAEPDEAAAAEPPAWERAATFVLSFEQRQVEGRSERKLVAEQTELEVEQTTTWPTWDTSGIADWLQHKLSDVEADDHAAAPQPQPAWAERAPETHPGQSPGDVGMRFGRGRLRIRLATIVDTTGSAEVVSDDRLTAQAVTCRVPGRLEVQVAGAEPKRDVQVALRFARTSQPGWSPDDPTTLSADGKAKIELTQVPTGQYEARILAWTPDVSAEHAAVGMGILSIV